MGSSEGPWCDRKNDWSSGGHSRTLLPTPFVHASFAHAMQVHINGEAKEVNDGLTIGELLTSLGLDRELVAVERNQKIVPRAEHGNTALREGDAIEIVRFVGGG